MPLCRQNTRTFHRALYGTILEKITLLKRGNDQQEGTVRALVIYQARRSMITKTGEPIQGDMSSDHQVVWHLPDVELARVGVAYINSLDRIVDKEGRYWQPEAGTLITVKLFGNHHCVACLRVDPPA